MFKQTCRQAVSNIFAAKLRSLLAVIGILVGTASVVALVISGELATQKALAQFKALGTDLLAISLFEKNPSGQVTPENTLERTEWAMMKRQIQGVIDIAPYVTLYNPISYKGHKIEATIIGADNSLASVVKIKLAKGRFVSFADNYSQFCVVGDGIAKLLRNISQGKLLGKQLVLGGSVYTIVGVLSPWIESAFFNDDVNKSVFIPIKGARVISNHAKISNGIIKLKPEIDIDKTNLRITKFVSNYAPALTVFPRSAKQIIQSMQAQGKIFTMLLGLIGGISLLVGGIGVMNVMLVTVVERKREIGIRKAIGAKRRDIQKLFLIEAVVLALFGGTLGVIFGILIAYIISLFSGWAFELYLFPPLIGFAVSVSTGIFFGFYPALRAARLDPIETLRTE